MGDIQPGLPEGDIKPRTMRRSTVRGQRRELLKEPHVRPLTVFTEALRSETGLEVPDFDPLDGGAEAEVLFLFEKPGPMTAADGSGRRVGSGFISRDNDDPTAEATFNFMRQAGIDRKRTITWNMVPGWNGTRKITNAELASGLDSLSDLIALLPRLRVVVLVGRKAARARRYLEERGMPVIVSDHPSPLVRAKFPDRWAAIPAVWSEAWKFLS